MKEKTKAESWRMDPDGSGVIRRVFEGRVYERRINKKSLLTPAEVADVLGLSVDRVCKLIEGGQMVRIFREGKPLVQLGWLLKFKNKKRLPGRPKEKR